MRRFSERHGFVKPRSVIQKHSMDDRLWNRLWSVMARCFWNHLCSFVDREADDFSIFIISEIQDKFLGKPIDELPFQTSDFVREIKSSFDRSRWCQFYDLIQFLADFSKYTKNGEPYSQARGHAEAFIERANKVLEEEKSAYRFVGGELVEITGEIEIEEIEGALTKCHIPAGSMAVS